MSHPIPRAVRIVGGENPYKPLEEEDTTQFAKRSYAKKEAARSAVSDPVGEEKAAKGLSDDDVVGRLEGARGTHALDGELARRAP